MPGKRDGLNLTFVIIYEPAGASGKRDVGRTFCFKVPATSISLIQQRMGGDDNVDTLAMVRAAQASPDSVGFGSLDVRSINTKLATFYST